MTSAPAAVAFEQFLASWTPGLLPWSLARYRGTSTVGFSPDGAALYHLSNEEGQQDLWRVWRDGRGRHRLTDLGERAARSFVVAPDGSLILAADRHGDEDHQLYRLRAGGGRESDRTGGEQRAARGADSPSVELVALTAREGVQHHLRARSLSRDGRFLAYSANLRDRANVEVVVRDLASGEERVVLGGDAWHVVGDWSPDARLLLASRVDDNTNQDLLLVDVRSGEVTNLTAHEGEMTNVPVGFDARGDGLYFITDRAHDFDWLARLDLRARAVSVVARQEWDVAFARLDRRATTLVWNVSQDGAARLGGRDEPTGAPLQLAALPRGLVNDLAVAEGGGAIAVVFTAPTAPWSLRVLDLAREEWSTPVAASIRWPAPLVADEPLRVPGPAGTIPAMLYRPAGAGPHPLLLHVHGGPEAQERPMYLALQQYLVARGVAVLVPNIHGSTGYGKAYQRAIHRDWGGIDLRDLEACVRWARDLSWVDRERIGIFGGSYGGFATLSAISRLPDYRCVAVDAFGPSDLRSFVRNGPPSWRRFHRRWDGDPDTEGERLLAASPIAYAERMRCPLLVIQGTKDPRVPRTESDQLVARLRALGRDVTYVVQENVGHGWTSRAHYNESYALVADFLLRHLLAA